MRKVGIVTLYGLKNYGNRLQAYALFNVLKKLNYSPVEICFARGAIPFIKEKIKGNAFVLFCREMILGILKRKKPRAVINRCRRLGLFVKFSKKIRRKAITSDSSKFYCYVCGSDQIWNPHFAGQSQYFATFAPKNKRISYAASFGIETLPEQNTDKYKKYLSEMHKISVREDAGAALVKELAARDAQVVLDPTLMLDGSEWKTIAQKPKFDIKGKYIFSYFLGEIPESTKNYMQNLADKNGLQIISLHKSKENDYWNFTGPAEFIWLIENAELICTDSFHASVFSILLNSPFIVFTRDFQYGDMSSRLDSLLRKFNLTDRFSKNIAEGQEFSIDYSHVAKILKAEREQSIKFLTDALKSVCKKDEND